MFSFVRKPPREIPNNKNRPDGFAWIGIVLLAMMMASCARPPAVSPVRGEVIPQAIEQPVAATPSVVQPLLRFSRGQVLYLRHCADCHGWEASGDGPLATILTAKPPALRQQLGVFAHNSNAQIVSRILYGTPFRTVQTGTPLYSEEEVTALVTYLQQMPHIRWEEVRRGKEVYDSLCAACHGLYGRGDGLGARTASVPLPDLSNRTVQQQVKDDTLVNSITNGKGAMPGAGDVLTPHEIRAVIAFLRVLSPGYELYHRFCAHCHGVAGVPVTSPSATPAPAPSAKTPPRIDTSYFQTHAPDQIRTAIQHMRRQPRPAMPHLARQLNADDADEIVRYLRTLAGTQ